MSCQSPSQPRAHRASRLADAKHLLGNDHPSLAASRPNPPPLDLKPLKQRETLSHVNGYNSSSPEFPPLHIPTQTLSTPHQNPPLSSRHKFPQTLVHAQDNPKRSAERLTLDAKARQTMAEEASNVTEDPKAWKWVIRKRIWDMMEAHNVAQNPRPVHHRIPNFVGAAFC
ncbi:hypothetical protein ACLB2K_011435 [Fragaria x ananassa]